MKTNLPTQSNLQPSDGKQKTEQASACSCMRKKGLLRELNPGPLAPWARIIPLDQAANWKWNMFLNPSIGADDMSSQAFQLERKVRDQQHAPSLMVVDPMARCRKCCSALMFWLECSIRKSKQKWTEEACRRGTGMCSPEFKSACAIAACLGKNDPGRTRTCNPRLRRPMLFPLGHGARWQSCTEVTTKDLV